jgi:hypothetical protein
MHRGRVPYLAALLVALLVSVAAPAVALAQSSGEDQYTDPLAGGGSGGGGGGSGGGGSSGGGGGGSSNPPANAAQAPSADTSPAPTRATPAQANRNNLPHTGFPVALLVGSGLIMVGTGLAVRRRTT